MFLGKVFILFNCIWLVHCGETVETTTNRPTFAIPSVFARKTTTKPPPTTTTAATTPAPSVPATKSTTFCECDLQYGCDFGCCCDPDCPQDAISNFDCAASLKEVFVDGKNFALPDWRTSDGWFCIFQSNEDNLSHLPIFNYGLKSSSGAFGWSNSESFDVTKLHSVMIFKETLSDEVFSFDMPYAAMGETCSILEPIRMLRSFDRYCHNTLENADNIIIKLRTMLFEAEIVWQRMPEVVANGTKIALYDCTDESDCARVSNDTLPYEGICTEVRVTFVHNFTHLLSSEVRFVYSDRSALDTNKVWQRFRVSFEDSDNVSQKASGPLGYVTGLPVLVAFDSADLTKVRELTVMGSNHGECDESIKQPILFGVSAIFNCRMTLSNTTVAKSSNMAEVCTNIQNIITQAVDTTDMLISELGRPQHTSNNWHKVNAIIHEDANGRFAESADFLTCKNIIVGLDYRFYTGTIMVNNVPYQKLIKHVEVQYGQRMDLKFQFEEQIKFGIQVRASFYDLTDIAANSADAVGLVAIMWGWAVLISFLINI